MNITAVIQCRMSSTRLPGKALIKFHGEASIGWIAEACKRATGISNIVIATSVNDENDKIEQWCLENSLPCFRGAEDDVLARYIGLMDQYNPDAVVRLTGDCPLADTSIISEVIALFKATGVKYASNTEPPTWSDGHDCEVISADAIRAAHAEATRPSDRECVTRWIVRNRHRFPAANLTCPIPGMVKERWVLDSPEDKEFITAIFNHFGPYWRPNWLNVLAALDAEPELRTINAGLRRNERFYDGLVSDIADGGKRFGESVRIFNKAEKLIPFAAQTFSKSHLQFPKGDSPLFLSHGDGGYCYDVDGNDYVDLVGALLPNVLGYRDPDIDFAIRRQLNSGISLSLATELEYKLASLLNKHIPCAEMVKFGKNGSDVTTAAVRLARTITGRADILKLRKNYHGWHDWAVDQTPRENGVATQVGVHICDPRLHWIKDSIAKYHPACVILEPEGWTKEDLQELRDLCTKHESLLIFDEIITGFRWPKMSYQAWVGVTPDLACFGKAMANGMPLSAIVGKAEYMKKFAPPDNIFYSGTFFGETLSLAAGIATIEKMGREDVIEKNTQTAWLMATGAQKLIQDAKLSYCISVDEASPIARILFPGTQSHSTEQIKAVFIKEMIQAGVLIIASHNVCYAHGGTEIKIILNAWERALGAVKKAIGSPLKIVPIQGASVRA